VLYAPPVIRRCQIVTAAVVLAVHPACGDDGEATSERDPVADADDDQPDAGFGPALRSDDDPIRALTVLRRPHAEVRERIGPHALTATTTLSLVPTRPPPDNPDVDSPVPPKQEIADQVALRWETPDESGPRFALEQHNDKERGRSIVVADGRLHARLEHRPWTVHALESEVYELWLDDAWRTGHDALEFLLPGASVTTQAAPGEGWNGGEAVRITLARGEGVLPPGRAEGWRGKVAFSALSGTLLVDVSTGAWLTLDAEATYTVSGGAGGPLTGQFEVHGRLAPSLPKAPQVATPKDAVALPERHRYEDERKRLLDGLAAP